MVWRSAPIDATIQSMRFVDSHLRWLWVTDSHLVNAFDSRDLNLRAAVEDCNSWRPNALIHTGDIGDNNPEKVSRAFNTLRGCQRPLYTVIGNHDEYEAVGGVPNTDYLATYACFNRSSPFYWTNVITSGDGTLTARCIYLDCNFYNVDASAPSITNAYHSPGDRVGWSLAEPSGGSYRQFGTTQLSWVQSVLTADVTSQIVLVFPHYPYPGQVPTDYKTLADKLQTDGRPAAFFCGHTHPDARTYTLTSTDGLKSYTMYKMCAMQESGAWCRVELHYSAGAIVVDQMKIMNFTDPGVGGSGAGGSWAINAPFS